METHIVKQSVRRNIKRFPDDFMFFFTKENLARWGSQIGMSRADKKGLRHPPMAFTEQGVAMLSSVLKSEHRHHAGLCPAQMLSSHEELKLKLKIEAMEARYDEQFQVVFKSTSSLLKRKN